ncbi:hypothetical protein BKA69DRAFT_1044400 [Paraphysoderma sedebokerense]|nr:hypothetical protein BKA69DRAFT_1044400 [Paraphysoderma sedebokerense]
MDDLLYAEMYIPRDGGDTSQSSGPTKKDEEKKEPSEGGQVANSAVVSNSSVWGFGSLISQVKKQSSTIAEVYKRDLSEFYNVVSAESHAAIDNLSHQVENISTKIKKLPNLETAFQQSSSSNQGESSSGTENEKEIEGNKSTRRELDEKTEVLLESETMILTKDLKDTLDSAEKLVSKWGAGVTNFLSSAVKITPPISSLSGSLASSIGVSSQSKQPSLSSSNISSSTPTTQISPKLASLLSNPSTYLTDPCNPVHPVLSKQPEKSWAPEDVESYKEFSTNFKISDYAGKVGKILSEEAVVSEWFDRFVPSHVSYDLFWTRYFFRMKLLEEEEERRKKLVEAAASGIKEEEFSWETDDSDAEDSKAVDTKLVQQPKAQQLSNAIPSGVASSSQQEKSQPALSETAEDFIKELDNLTGVSPIPVNQTASVVMSAENASKESAAEDNDGWGLELSDEELSGALDLKPKSGERSQSSASNAVPLPSNTDTAQAVSTAASESTGLVNLAKTADAPLPASNLHPSLTPTSAPGIARRISHQSSNSTSSSFEIVENERDKNLQTVTGSTVSDPVNIVKIHHGGEATTEKDVAESDDDWANWE